MNKTPTQEEILKLYGEITERRQKIVELLKSEQMPVRDGYELYNWQNERTDLADLFGDKDDLIVIHNMGKRCIYCTMWADEINGVRHHLENRAALALVSRDPIELQQEFAASRNWGFAMLSDRDHQFTREMGFAYDKDGSVYTNPGYSTFKKLPDGSIARVGYDFFGPGDMYSSVWHFFELLDNGENGWEPQYSYENAAETATTA